MKKYLALILCLACGLICISGCQGPGKSGSSPTKARGSVSDKANSESTAVKTSNWVLSKYDTVNNFAGVTMRVKADSSCPTGLTAVFENKSTSKCIYGEFFKLEKRIGGKWYEVPVTVKDNYCFNYIAYTLDSGESRDWEVDWKWLYGSLDAGKYRIVKDTLDFRGTGDYDKYFVAAEFDVM